MNHPVYGVVNSVWQWLWDPSNGTQLLSLHIMEVKKMKSQMSNTVSFLYIFNLCYSFSLEVHAIVKQKSLLETMMLFSLLCKGC